MTTYSFLSVNATLSGFGGNIPLGYGAGVAKEGITIEMLEDKDAMVTGSGGEIMHTLKAGQAGRITVRLLKTSATNAKLSQMYNVQRLNPALWGRNTLVVNDAQRGDVVAGDTMAFVKHTGVTYAEDATMNEWAFLGNVNMLLGTGDSVAA
jgi:hypothetical protein